VVAETAGPVDRKRTRETAVTRWFCIGQNGDDGIGTAGESCRSPCYRQYQQPSSRTGILLAQRTIGTLCWSARLVSCSAPKLDQPASIKKAFAGNSSQGQATALSRPGNQPHLEGSRRSRCKGAVIEPLTKDVTRWNLTKSNTRVGDNRHK